MIIIENRTVPCNPRSKNYAKGTVVNVSGSTSTSAFVYTPTYDEIINTLKNGKDYITIPTILEVYGDLYSLGEVSAFGAGSGGSSGGGGLIQTVYGSTSLGGVFNNADLTNTFNAYTINQLHLRLSQVEDGAAVDFSVVGAGNAITGIAKNGNVLEFTKGLTFSLAGHTHDYIPLSQKGTANGVASLDANGLIISAQLPSYVDDVIEVSTYANLPVSGESGKIYVTIDTNITYRWTGTIYVEISKSIALGETSSTAYRGDLGAIAYAHSQIAGGTGVHVSSTERTNWNLAYTNNHTHANKSVLDGITSTLISNWNTSYTNNHTHANKSLLDAFSQSDNDVLNHLSIVDGKLKVDIDLYSLGEVSAFGAGSGSGGSGLIQTVYGYSGLGGTYNNAILTDTFNAYAINKINTDLGARITSLEAGSALTFTAVGSGNAVTSVTKSGTSVTVTKGLTFSVDGHTHTFASLTSKPTTLSGYGITDALLKKDGSMSIIANNFTYSGYGFGYASNGFPANGSFISFGGGGSDSYVTQIQGNYGGTGIYYRTRNDDNGTWSIWRTVLDDVNAYTKTLADNTFLKLAGGTMTGNLTAPNYLRLDGATIWHSGNFNPNLYLPLSGGIVDYLHVNSTLHLHQPSSSTLSQIDFYDIANTTRLVWLGANATTLLVNGNTVYHSGNIPTWNQNTTGNAGSATKLQTAITIWGQNFDGSDNISGAMSGVTSITMSGALNGGTTSSFSSYSTANRFYTGYDSGIPNSISCSGWFRSNGSTGWYNATYGGGICMEDSTYVRVYNNKAFWVDNNIVATGEITAFGASDIRLKSNIKQIDSALNFLSKVKTYEFDWNEKAIELNPLKTKRGAGVIAQEMSLLDNNFVHSIYGDYLGVDYERFIPYLIGGVNEVADEVTILKKRVAELELEVKRLIA